MASAKSTFIFAPGIATHRGFNVADTTIELSSRPPYLVDCRLQGPEVILHKIIPSDPELLDQVVAEIIQAAEGNRRRANFAGQA